MGSGASKSHIAPNPSTGNLDDNVISYSNNTNNSTVLGGISDQNSSLGSALPGLVVSAKKLAAMKRKEKEERRQKILWEYPELADALHSAHEWMQEIAQNKGDDVTRKKMNMKTRQKLEELYNMYFDCEEAEHRKILGDQLCQDNAGQLCTEYLKILTNEGKNTPTEGYDFECLVVLRSVCWNYSDASLDFSTELGRMGSFPILIADLVTFKDKMETYNIREQIILPSISILHNCAKAPDNKKYFKSGKAVEAIVPYTKVEYQELKMIAMMTLAYMIDESDNDKISADGTMIDFILKYFSNSITAIDHKYAGFSAQEIASGIMHLASNDDNKLTIVNQGVLPLLVKLLQNGDDAEKAVSAKTVWVLAFRDENKIKIKEEENMMKLLKDLAEKPGEARESASGALWVLGDNERIEKIRSSLNTMVTSSFSSLSKSKTKKKSKSPKAKSFATSSKKRKSAQRNQSNFFKKQDGIKVENEKFSLDEDILEEDLDDKFFNDEDAGTEEELEQEDDEREDERLQQETRRKDGHVMISYQWGCQKLMLRVKDRLEKMRYKVWIDVESMGGSTLQAMAEAVENSEVVVICMSQKYKESPNCRTEAEYAYKLGKPLIPVKVESGYEADGWLGALQGAKFYVDFSNLMVFDKMFSKLMKELGDKGKTSDLPDGPISPIRAAPVLALPPQLSPRIPVNKWTKDEVTQWATKYQIQSRKIQNLDGETLIFLSSLKLSAPEFFYKYISERFGIIELRDLMTITRGLENLEH